MAFVSPDTDDFFLSKEAMQQLAIIPKDFPNVGAADVTAESATILTQPLQLPPSKPLIATTTTEAHGPAKDKCQCLKRVKPPGRPLKLPFPPMPEFNLKFERWLKERYASFTFNRCPHQLLPEVVGPKIPPLTIHFEEDAVPVVHHKPGFIPLHHFDQVIEDLKKDIAMGVLEYPPLNEPVIWCHKMIIVTKPDGTPRRAVDMSSLNKFCKREPHIGKNPFHMAHAIPRNVWKSFQDAWNGYHGIPIREKDRHLTTFQTPIQLE